MDYPTDKVIFFADGHSYWLGEDKLDSISKYKNKWMPEYPREFWLTYKVLKAEFGEDFNIPYKSFSRSLPKDNYLFKPYLDRMDSNIFEMDKKRLAEQWERKSVEALFKGSRFHGEFERRTFENGFMVNPWDKMKYPVTTYPKLYDNESLSLDLFDLPDGGYPELLIFDIELGIAGQSDEVYIQTVGKKRYVDINDLKTGEFAPGKGSPDYCFAPFQKEYASKHFGYVLQVNMYAHMLSKFGFTVRNLGYTYYPNFNEKEPFLENIDNLQKKLLTFLK